MGAGRIAAVMLLCLLAMGCRLRNDPTVALLESELRWLEDQLYELEDQYAMQTAQLESCRRENRSLRKELEEANQGGPRSGGSAAIAPLLTPPARRPVDGPPSMPVGPPTIELGTPTDPPGFDEFPPPRKSSSHSPQKPPLELNALADGPLPGTADEAGVVKDRRITQLFINRHLTGGYDVDGETGHDGLQVVIEPRNAEGQYVDAPGPVSIVLLDAAKEGEAARVARWDFDSTETAAMIRRTLLGRGIRIELPWPNQPPQNRQLELIVRYETTDGRKLEARQAIQVEVPNLASERWTPSSRPSRVARRDEGGSGGTQSVLVGPDITQPGNVPPRSADDGDLPHRPDWQPFR